MSTKRRNYFVILCLLFISISSGAQSLELPQDTPAPTPSSQENGLGDYHFKNWGVFGNFSPFEMWVITKYGITGMYTKDPAWNYELEYMRGSLDFGFFGIDIGEIQEERLSLLARSFSKRNSFNFLYGVFYNHMEVGLSSKFTSTLSAFNQSADQVDLSFFGLTWGMGNRWQTQEGYVIGVDWLVINLPFSVIQEHAPFLKNTTDQDRRNQVKNSLDWLKKFPSLGILKVQIGLSF
jgi:hypothetical protein